MHGDLSQEDTTLATACQDGRQMCAQDLQVGRQGDCSAIRAQVLAPACTHRDHAIIGDVD
eukprot:14563506-Alexandrium_andersonii.AAC.1